MSKPDMYCIQCRSRHQVTAKNFPGEISHKEPVRQEDGSFKIVKFVDGLVCKKCMTKEHIKRLKPEIRKQFKLKKEEPVTKYHINLYFKDLQRQMQKVMRGDK